MPKFLTSNDIFTRLHEHGVVQHDPSYVRRVVIDLKAGEVARVYVELFADDEKLMPALEAGLYVDEGYRIEEGHVMSTTEDNPETPDNGLNEETPDAPEETTPEAEPETPAAEPEPEEEA